MSNLGKRDLVRDVTKNLLAELQRSCVQTETIDTVKQCSIVPGQSNLVL